jgi:diguanylate cyclase (GGDEF)-like protein
MFRRSAHEGRMRFPIPNFRPNWLHSPLSAFTDHGIDDDLLRYLVGTVHGERGILIASSVMGALVTAESWGMTGAAIFLCHGLGHVVVGAGRLRGAHHHLSSASPGAPRATTLAFDAASSFWSAAYALLLGLTCYSLSARARAQDTLPLAVAICVGFTISFVSRSAGRMRMLTLQILAISGPMIYGMLTLEVANGRYYAVLFLGIAPASIVMGLAANARIVELFRANDANRRMARLDMHTSLMNRFAFTDALADASRSINGRFALMTIDLDRFKEVNDTLGHLVGDAVIRQTADRLREVVGPRDFVARLGGDEFVILVRSGDLDARGIDAFAGRVVAALRRAYEFETLALPASASVGVALFPDHGTDVLDLMKHADIALYESKRAGRGRHRVFNDSMRSKLADARMLELEMGRAIRADQFEPWFQPIQDIETGEIRGYEALARWRHPTLGLISPDRFIPIAEQNGAIVEIGHAILEKACRAAASWDPRLTIAVNLSPGEFRRPAQLVGSILETLRATGLDPSRLFIEITESLMMEDTPQTRSAIQQLADHAVRFSLDDFGAGYSSLSYIQSYPFSKIKIDKKFIDHIDSDDVSAAIVASVRVLAERVRMDIVAEGVETRAQQTALRSLGIRLAQGYLYGRPSPRIVAEPLLQLAASA